MSKEMYYVICVSVDGTSLSVLTKEELEEKLKLEDGTNYWGNPPMHDTEMAAGEDAELYDLPNAEVGLYIIKGVSVKPKPKEVVKSWEV